MVKAKAADLIRRHMRNERDEMARVQADVRAGSWYQADPDSERRAKLFVPAHAQKNAARRGNSPRTVH